MKLKVKKLNDKAALPYKATSGSAAFDVTATSLKRDANGNLVYGLGIALEVPQGYYGALVNRSSIREKDLRIMQGTIDSDYRGEVKAVFTETSHPAKIYAVGDRVAQLLILPVPQIEVVESSELSETTRGNGGFGSTGK
jgi:dUTP pyrophosphatase